MRSTITVRLTRLEAVHQARSTVEDPTPLLARLLQRLAALGDRMRATADLAWAVSTRVDADGTRLHAVPASWCVVEPTTYEHARAIVHRRLMALGFRKEPMQ